MSLKNPVTPPGIDPGTVRLVAQRLNHYATPGPNKYGVLFVLFVLKLPSDHGARCSREFFGFSITIIIIIITNINILTLTILILFMLLPKLIYSLRVFFYTLFLKFLLLAT
jgi:hypothetical protein